MKKLFLLTALFVAAVFSSCSKHDGVETPVPPEPVVEPEPQPLAIAFDEGNSLEFGVDETKTVHYTITGGSDKTVVKAELQTSDDAYTVKTAPTSATEGAITITANTPETENCIVVTVSDGDRSIAAEIAVSTKPIPEELAIAFAEGNSLEFNVNETKTVHYTITGGSDKTVVKAELQTPDDAYTVETAPTSATEGTITITANTPETENCVVVSVSDGSQTVMAEIVVSTKPGSKGNTITVETPGTLWQLLADYDRTTITELTVIGNLNDEDIVMLNYLPNLAILDMENANLEVLQYQAFKDKTSLTSIKLPKTLKTIEDRAFDGCSSLTSITIPNGVTTIGSWAFIDCSSLTSVTIPNSVAIIGGRAFDGCSSLTSITIPDSVTTIWDRAFSGCSSLTSITIPDSVTTIWEGVFYMCSSLTSVTIGNGVTTIGFGAFSSCSSLTSITIPDSVTTIGEGVFGCCSSLSAFYGKFASSDNRCLIDGMRLIAFAPAGLTSYTIPDGVTSIGQQAFVGYSSLTSITIPNSVTTIGANAFLDCSSLTSITIPNSVTTIGYGAFNSCSSLTSIYCKAQTPPTINRYGAFNGVESTTLLYVPIGSADAYRAAGQWKQFTNINEMEFE